MSSLLAFHAHPDDESVATGVTLAKYAHEGHDVVVVTATDGSEGEILNHENPEEAYNYVEKFNNNQSKNNF